MTLAPTGAGTAPASERVPWWRRPPIGWFLLAVLAYVPPLLSAPGKVAADTKQYLYLDPARLLGRAASMWDPNTGMGTVTHQNIGYLFPMGPYYWLLDRLGVPDWVAQRLWLGTIIFAAAAGVLYLGGTLSVRGPGIVVAALAYAFSPYVLHYSARISVILLPWAALGWLVAFAIRALRDGGWRYPALFAIVVQIVGGVNATALVFAGIAPVAWMFWATFATREVTWKRALAATARIGTVTILASAWWIAGLSLQSGYGINILQYTETVRAVARTSMANEVLRGLGYWFFYGRDRLGPWIEAAENYTQRPTIIFAGYALACLALVSSGLIKWRHRGYFVLLVLVGLVISVGAHPYDHPTPLGMLFKAFATSSNAGLALRSTGRAIPLVLLGLAVLLGRGVDAAYGSLVRRGRRALAAAVPVLVVAIVFVNVPALYDGTYYGENLQRPEEIPEYWNEAAAFVDGRGNDTRVLELAGSDFASYTWGNTVDPITPGLIDRPYVARELIPYGTPGTADVLNAFDRRIQEGVDDPDGFAAMLRRLAVGDVVLRNDIEHDRYNLPSPEQLQSVFDPAPRGLARVAAFGDATAVDPSRFLDERDYLQSLATPEPVVVYEVDDPWSVVRAQAARGAIVVAGDGEGIVDLAETGLLDNHRVVLESAAFGDDRRALVSAAGDDAVLVLTDTNRRRGRRWASVRDNTGYTERRGERPLEDVDGDARLPVFPDAPPGSFTTTDQVGVERVAATSYGNRVTFTPEDRAARAFDGDLTTFWQTAAYSDATGERILVELDESVGASSVNVVQVQRNPGDRTISEVDVRFDGADSQRFSLDERSLAADGQTLDFGSRTFRTLEIEVAATSDGNPVVLGRTNGVGFAEIRLVPDGQRAPVQVHEVVVMPTDMLDAFADTALDHPLVVVMSRLRGQQVPPRSEEEREMQRRFAVPDARRFSLVGTARVASTAPAAVIDELLGRDGGVMVTASASLPGCVACLPASAFDGDANTAWTTPIGNVAGAWIEATLAGATTVDGIDVRVIDDGRHTLPNAIRIETANEGYDFATTDGTIVTSRDGDVTTMHVELPSVTAAGFRITFIGVDAREAPSFHNDAPQTLPVGVAEIDLAGARIARSPDFVTTCRDDLVTIDGDPIPVRVSGSTDDAIARRPLAVEACSESDVALAAGEHEVGTARGQIAGVDIDRIVLASAAGGEEGLATADGRITAVGTEGEGEVPSVRVVKDGRTKMRLEVDGATEPFWLVLGQSQSDGWVAKIAGRGDLGTSQLVDGYANGWYVDPGRRESFTVTLEWEPQRRVWIALAISALALLACVAIVVTTRKRAQLVGVIDDGVVALHSPLQPLGGSLLPGAMVAGPLVAGSIAAITIAPWAGAIVAVLVLLALRIPRARGLLTVLPPLLLLAAALYIVRNQIRYDLPPVFEWPTFFPRALPLAWLAVALAAADALVEQLQRGRGASQPPIRSEAREPGEAT